MGDYGRDIERVLKEQTRRFALCVLAIAQDSPRGLVSDVLIRQLVRSSTSVGANYRSACRARSKADMASKLAVAEEELDESLYWLEMLVESHIIERSRVADLTNEADEILRLFVASSRTLRHVAVREDLTPYSPEDEFTTLAR